VEEYVKYYSDTLRQNLTETIIKGPKTYKDGLFAPACLAHCLEFSGNRAPRVNQIQHYEALAEWYFELKDYNMHIDNIDNITWLKRCSDQFALTSFYNLLRGYVPSSTLATW